MSPSRLPPSSSRPPQKELVQVDTALAVLSKVNLLEESTALALDIGGSLAKLIYLQPHRTHTTTPPLLIHKVDGNIATAQLSVHVPELKGTLHFFAFETRNIHQLLRFIRTHWANDCAPNPDEHLLIRATGGGSYKYAGTFIDEIGVQLARLDEMACTVAGLNFLLTTVKNEVYVYVPSDLTERAAPSPGPAADFERTTRYVDTTRNPFPYLLVNIGSGVSIVKVTAHDTFERVSGSSLGGGTFWGLARMLLDCATFDDVIRLTHDGNNANVDMLVGDIYGGSYASLGLDASVIAASFGKATMRNNSSRAPITSWAAMKERLIRAVSGSWDLWMAFFDALPGIGSLLRAFRGGPYVTTPKALMGTALGQQFRPQDVALALLRMVSYNIGQIAYLNARVHGLDRIYFGGNFIRNHPYTIADISFAVDFWSNGKTKALFLRHDGYLGAIGAFIGASSAAPTDFVEKHLKREKVGISAAPREAKKGVDGRKRSSKVPRNGTVKKQGEVRSSVAKRNGTKKSESGPGEDAEDTPVNGTVRKSATTRRKKGMSRESQVSGLDGRKQGREWDAVETIPSDVPSPSVDGVADQDGGEWTTVKRVRRRAQKKFRPT